MIINVPVRRVDTRLQISCSKMRNRAADRPNGSAASCGMALKSSERETEHETECGSHSGLRAGGRVGGSGIISHRYVDRISLADFEQNRLDFCIIMTEGDVFGGT